MTTAEISQTAMSYTAYVLRTSSPDVFATDDARDVAGKKLKIGSIVAIRGGDVARVYAIARQSVSNGSFWIAGARSCQMSDALDAGLTETSPRVVPQKTIRKAR